MVTRAVPPTKIAQLKAAAEVDPLMVALSTATPAQIDAWVKANVTTIAQAQTAIAFLAKCIVYVWKNQK